MRATRLNLTIVFTNSAPYNIRTPSFVYNRR